MTPNLTSRHDYVTKNIDVVNSISIGKLTTSWHRSWIVREIRLLLSISPVHNMRPPRRFVIFLYIVGIMYIMFLPEQLKRLPVAMVVKWLKKTRKPSRIKHSASKFQIFGSWCFFDPDLAAKCREGFQKWQWRTQKGTRTLQRLAETSWGSFSRLASDRHRLFGNGICIACKYKLEIPFLI